MRLLSIKKRYYESLTQDFEKTKNQDIKLGDDYKFIKTGFFDRFLSAVIYGAAVILSYPYCRFFLHIKFEGRKKLKDFKNTGYFLFANHTQPVGDVFTPAHALFPKRIYTIVSTANYGIPVIGKILPYLGALPVIESVKGLKNLTQSIKTRLSENKCIVIYPEAHVWEYYTGIRPMPESAFTFPLRCAKPSYAMTVTYKKRRIGKKPAAVVHLDGPFYPDESLPPRRRAAALRDTVYAAMLERSRESDTEYIRYEPAGAGNMDIQDRSNTAVTEKG